jgi:hypothetical protein
VFIELYLKDQIVDDCRLGDLGGILFVRDVDDGIFSVEEFVILHPAQELMQDVERMGDTRVSSIGSKFNNELANNDALVR